MSAYMNHRELGQMYRTLGPRQTCQMVTECLRLGREGQPGGLVSSDFSLREVAESCIENGREWVAGLDPKYGGGQAVMEAGDGVDTTAFSNITGQLMVNEVMAGYQRPEFVISNLFRTISTRLDGEKIIGLAKPDDQTESIHPGMPYPHAGFGEDYTETPSTTKHGVIIPVTKEAVFFDRTGTMLENANSVGEMLGTDKEKRCVDVFIGAVNTHNWRGTAYNTYLTSGTPWENVLAGSAYELLDYDQIDAARILWAEMTDPNTGEPILISGGTIVVPPHKTTRMDSLLNAMQVRLGGSSPETLVPNPIAGRGLSGMESQYVYSRLQSQGGLSAANAQKTWFIGDMAKAFAYMQNWPITVVQAPQNSEAEFNQDIVARFKASERGVAHAKNPRYVIKVNGYG